MTPATDLRAVLDNAVTDGKLPPPRIGGGKNHATPVTRLEDNKLATDFGLGILGKRIDEIHHIVVAYHQKNLPATSAWEQITAVINRS